MLLQLQRKLMAQGSEVFKVALQDETNDTTKRINRLTNKQKTKQIKVIVIGNHVFQNALEKPIFYSPILINLEDTKKEITLTGKIFLSNLKYYKCYLCFSKDTD